MAGVSADLTIPPTVGPAPVGRRVAAEESSPAASAATASGGRVEAIHVVARRRARMQPLDRARAIAGRGLEGDRYTLLPAEGLPGANASRELTLIEAETVEALSADHGIQLAPGETRRNVTTRGIRLDELVGRQFRIGPVVCEGVAHCEPCQYLADLLGKPVLRPLVHRGGLIARIVSDGEIAVGDEIEAID